MNPNNKINEIIKLSRTAPVLAVGYSSKSFGASTIISAGIPSAELGIVNTISGLQAPSWFYEIVKGKSSHQIVIDGIDSIDKESQKKFYELLKYKAISDVELPADCTIIVTANNINNVSQTILRLCLLAR